jgi:PAS domain S-box-containing protein
MQPARDALSDGSSGEEGPRVSRVDGGIATSGRAADSPQPRLPVPGWPAGLALVVALVFAWEADAASGEAWRAPLVLALAGIVGAIAWSGRRRVRPEPEPPPAAARAEMLEGVLESTTDYVLVLDRGFRITFVNGRAAGLLGPDDLVGRQLFDAFSGCEGSAFEEAYRRALATGRPQSITDFHPSLGRWISADAFPAAEGLTVFFRDVTALRAAEVALRENEARLNAILDNLPVGALLAEAPGGRVVAANRRFAELVGAPPGATLGLMPYARPVFEVLAGAVSATLELELADAKARPRALRASAAPVRDAAGALTGVVLTLLDISDERRATAALSESELRFRTLAETVPQIVWSSDARGGADYVNPRFAEFTGFGAEADPSPGGPATHPEDAPGVAAAWAASLNTGEPFVAEYRLRGADGGWRWFVARAQPVQDGGAARRWIGAATDVTDLIAARVALESQVLAEAAARQAAVAAAEALSASEERFRRFAEASPDVLWITDVSGRRIDYISPAFERIWGLPRHAIEQDHAVWSAAVLPADRAAFETAQEQAVRGEPFEREFRIHRPDGSERWIREAGFPILDSGGRVARRGGFARDVTAAKLAEERQGLLIGELNHRVKNTLATVHSLAQQTARGAVAVQAPIGRFLDDFQARLLALARAHDLLTAETWRGAPLRQVVEAALAPWQPADRAAGVRVAVSGPPVWLSPRAALGLSLAVHELATNAAKHGAMRADAGRVALGWRRDPDDMVVLNWAESGGPPALPPRHKGFGTRLLERGLPVELGPGAAVRLHYAPEGFRAEIRFRLNPVPSDSVP